MVSHTGSRLLLLVALLCVTQIQDARSLTECECKEQGTCSKKVGNDSFDLSAKCLPGFINCCEETEISKTCGIRNDALIPTTNKGAKKDKSYFGEFPWTAVILSSQKSKYIGGGVIVDNKHILTTAHTIIIHNIGIKVRLGEWDMGNKKEKYPHQDFTVSAVQIHPEFDLSNLQNDIAVITLSKPVKFDETPHIAPVCLPQINSDPTKLRCWVSGYGKNNYRTGSYQKISKKIELPIINATECENILRTTKLGSNFNLDSNSFLCAGGEKNKDSCTGDGGSPLVCDNDGRFEVVGLVSWGVGCGTKGVPAVYLNVVNYLDNIKKLIKN